MTHQVQIVKYFRGLVHLSHGDQDLIVDVLLVGSHVKAYPGLQGSVHLQQRMNAFCHIFSPQLCSNNLTFFFF